MFELSKVKNVVEFSRRVVSSFFVCPDYRFGRADRNIIFVKREVCLWRFVPM